MRSLSIPLGSGLPDSLNRLCRVFRENFSDSVATIKCCVSAGVAHGEFSLVCVDYGCILMILIFGNDGSVGMARSLTVIGECHQLGCEFMTSALVADADGCLSITVNNVHDGAYNSEREKIAIKKG